jgi:hypothetical protein
METVSRQHEQRRPGTFWRLSFPSNSPGVRDVNDYDYEDYDEELFNQVWYTLSQGKPFDGCLPESLRLWVDEGDGPIADHVGNPIGWTIMSDALVDHLSPLIQDCVKLFPAPIFDKSTGLQVEGFRLINVTKLIDCVDLETSTPSYDEDGIIESFIEVCIDSRRASGAHMFKYVISDDMVDTGVTCSYELVSSLVGRGFTGLAFLPYDCRE